MSVPTCNSVALPTCTLSLPKGAELSTVAIEALVFQGIKSLNRLASCRSEGPELSAAIRQLRDAIRLVSEPSRNWTPKDQLRLVHQFSSWIPSISFGDISKQNSIVLAILAHFFAVPLVLELVYYYMLTPVSLPLISSIRTKGISEIDILLRRKEWIYCEGCGAGHDYYELMAFPLNTLHLFQYYTDIR